MWMNYDGYGMGWHAMGWMGMVFFWLVLILLVLVAVKYLTGSRRSDAQSEGANSGALAILEQRYARGELDREEYLQMRDDLKKG
jgi:putative membrane protein